MAETKTWQRETRSPSAALVQQHELAAGCLHAAPWQREADGENPERVRVCLEGGWSETGTTGRIILRQKELLVKCLSSMKAELFAFRAAAGYQE